MSSPLQSIPQVPQKAERRLPQERGIPPKEPAQAAFAEIFLFSLPDSLPLSLCSVTWSQALSVC